MNLEWEMIIPARDYNFTERLKVPGGWVICRTDGGKNPQSMTSCFVADPDYTWQPEIAAI